jgi:hypothetical protein
MTHVIRLPLILVFLISAASSTGCALSSPGRYTETDESPADLSDGQETRSCFTENAEGAIVETPCPMSIEAKYRTQDWVPGGCADPNVDCNDADKH